MSDRPSRRWFRFSLKTLLVLMTVLAVWLGLYMKSFRDRRATIAEIERLNGAISYQYIGPIWLRKLVRDEKYFWNPIAVRFSRTNRITDNELQVLTKQLVGLEGLTYVMLAHCQITDAGLAGPVILFVSV